MAHVAYEFTLPNGKDATLEELARDGYNIKVRDPATGRVYWMTPRDSHRVSRQPFSQYTLRSIQ